MKFGIHWFRRDLRVAGNPALEWCRKSNDGRVVGIFVFDPKFLSRPDIGISRFAFLIETLSELKKELKSLGGDLLVLDQGPDTAFESLFSALEDQKSGLPSTLTYNRDYEPFARERDARVEGMITHRFKIAVHSERDHLLIEPHEISKDHSGGSQQEGWYQVYSPFQKKWMAKLGTAEVRKRLVQHRAESFCLSWDEVLPKKLKERFSDQLETYQKSILPRAEVPLPPVGHAAALRQLDTFKESGIENYAETRDIPGIDGTSRLSIYLKNGSLTIAQVIAHLGLAGQSKFLNELIWREFYYHILFHAPRVEKEAFQIKYKTIAWENDPKLFQSWCDGKTGYPVVDAAMRQLNTTGWMHNRMRMVVASFLTKDLLIDWRWGERYFMQKLLDGDLAPNNGGWQWAASTGCDPQPYFRIFNPTLQSKRYDPDGSYIRQFVPELAHLDSRKIHEPWKLNKLPAGYPKRIVDHSSRSMKAISLFKRA